MKLFKATVEIAFEDDSITESAVQNKLSQAIQSACPGKLFFRVGRVEINRTTSGSFKLDSAEAERLKIK